MQVDLTNCEREQIHLLGHVQSFGCLLALSPDWIVVHASRNTVDHIGLEAEAILGKPFRELISADAVHSIRGQMQSLVTEDSIARVFDIQLFENNPQRFSVAIHRSGQTTICEIELLDTKLQEVDALPQVRGIVERLKTLLTVKDLTRQAARFLRALSGFDRVMVYRFAPDHSGEVVAEALAPGYEPFLGLRYPASDIPSQARALYKRSPIRIISDVNDQVSEIIPPASAAGEQIDLSLSTLRAVSPIHLEYLRNMGVSASMSISIMDGDKLWGLFACHHHAPRRLSYATRSACDLFGQMFGFLLSQLNSKLAFEESESARSLHNSLMRSLAEGASIIDEFEYVTDELGKLIRFDGAAGWIDGQFVQSGTTPTQEEVLALTRFLNTTAVSSVYTTDCLKQVYPPAADFVTRAAGLMALPVSRTPRDFVILFRGEIAKTVTWAGNPDKPVELGPNGARLTPRKSFEAWTSEVSGCSAEWTAGEIQVAEAIRITLLEIILRMSEEASAFRRRANEKQELLIAELNHRVRNILNLIKGLVHQSRSDTGSVLEFTKVVGDRIHALARAHDQITSATWDAASLCAMIRTEFEAYIGRTHNRITIVGGDAIMQPEALTTLALVFHEMTTNSAKYGALGDSGRVIITLQQPPEGGLIVQWEEIDGPAVKPPLRRGFGSTVIERSIPFELGGSAEISYPITGVRGTFFIPARHIKEFSEGAISAPQTPSGEKLGAAATVSFGGDALLVEDNLISAMDGESFLTDLGASRVHIASTVRDAAQIIETQPVAYAVLDLNLGAETSLPVAQMLADRGVPFVFATGYGEAAELTQRFATVPVLTKPYDKPSLAECLAKIFPSPIE